MKRVFLFFCAALSAVSTVAATNVSAAEPGSFSLQVSPSPLVLTLKPGQTTNAEIKVRNTGTQTERLKIETRAFKYDNQSGTVTVEDTKEAAITSWLSFSAPQFSVDSNQFYTQKIAIAVPSNAGFSYSFALRISRVDNPTTNSGRQINPSIAIFTLLNIDRPGAKRDVELTNISTDHQLYEYLPATINLDFKNTGNTIVRPYGNIFIQRQSGDTDPIETLKVNANDSYILPDTNRTLSASWSDGFPQYVTSTGADGKPSTTTKWDFTNLAHFRIGKYTAKVVAVYNDGQRDVPIIKEVTFWVFPWRAALIALGVLIVLIVAGRFYVKRRTDKAVKKALANRKG